MYKTTEAGQEFCALLPEEVVRPDISAIWERSFEKIASQELRITEFLSSVDDYLDTRIEHVKTHGVPFSKRQGITCPTCQQGSSLSARGATVHSGHVIATPIVKPPFPMTTASPTSNPSRNKLAR
ncbi:DNA topoisomerase III [Vibrio astriarenae]|nr:DNA topoisomerase III [Vibrio sp. C7]